MQSDKMTRSSFTTLMSSFIGKKQKEKKQRLEENLRLRNIAFVNKILKEVDDDENAEGGWKAKLSQGAKVDRTELPSPKTSPTGEIEDPLRREMEDILSAGEQAQDPKRGLDPVKGHHQGFGVTQAEKRQMFKSWLGTRSAEAKKEIKNRYDRMSPEQRVEFEEGIVNKLMTARGYNTVKSSYSLANTNISPARHEEVSNFFTKAAATYLNQRATGNKNPQIESLVLGNIPDIRSALKQMGDLQPHDPKFQEILAPLFQNAAKTADAKFWNSRLDAYPESYIEEISTLLHKRKVAVGKGSKASEKGEGKGSKYGEMWSNPLSDVGRETIGHLTGKLPLEAIAGLWEYYKNNKEEVMRANQASVRSGSGMAGSGIQGNANAITKKSPLLGSEHEGSFVPAKYAAQLAKTGKLSDREWLEIAAQALDPEKQEAQDPGGIKVGSLDEPEENTSKRLLDRLIDALTKYKQVDENGDPIENPAAGAAPNEIKHILSLAIDRSQNGSFKRMKSLEEIKDKLHPEYYKLAEEIIDKLDPKSVMGAQWATDIRPPFQDLAKEEGEKIYKGTGEKMAAPAKRGIQPRDEGHLAALRRAQKEQAKAKAEEARAEQGKERELKSRRMDPRDIETGRRDEIRRRREALHASIERARKMKSAESPEEIRALKSDKEGEREVDSRKSIWRAEEGRRDFEEQHPEFASFMRKTHLRFPKDAEEIIRIEAQKRGIELPRKASAEHKFEPTRDIGAIYRGGLRPIRGGGDPLAAHTPEELERKELAAEVGGLIAAAKKKFEAIGAKPERKSVLQYILGRMEEKKIPQRFMHLQPAIEKLLKAEPEKSSVSHGAGSFSSLKKGREVSGPVKGEPDSKMLPHMSDLGTGRVSDQAEKYRRGERTVDAKARPTPEPTSHQRPEKEEAEKKPVKAHEKGAPKKETEGPEPWRPTPKKAGSKPKREPKEGWAEWEKKNKISRKKKENEKQVEESYSIREMVLGADGKQVKHTEKERPWEEAKPNKKYSAPKMTLKEIFEDKK